VTGASSRVLVDPRLLADVDGLARYLAACGETAETICDLWHDAVTGGPSVHGRLDTWRLVGRPANPEQLPAHARAFSSLSDLERLDVRAGDQVVRGPERLRYAATADPIRLRWPASSGVVAILDETDATVVLNEDEPGMARVYVGHLLVYPWVAQDRDVGRRLRDADAWS
jgi:hypothetical protein